MKKWSLTVLLILALTGCTAVSAPVDSSPEPQTEGIAGLAAENYPHVDGSTATLPLIAGLYSRATGTDRKTAECFRVVKVSTMLPLTNISIR